MSKKDTCYSHLKQAWLSYFVAMSSLFRVTFSIFTLAEPRLICSSAICYEEGLGTCSVPQNVEAKLLKLYHFLYFWLLALKLLQRMAHACRQTMWNSGMINAASTEFDQKNTIASPCVIVIVILFLTIVIVILWRT